MYVIFIVNKSAFVKGVTLISLLSRKLNYLPVKSARVPDNDVMLFFEIVN